MSNYKSTVRRHRRLAILRHLAGSDQYTANVSILEDVLAGVGIPSTRDQVRTEINWLDQNAFVRATDYDGFVVVAATRAGVEIAEGRGTHPEIERPSPRV